MHLPVFIFFLLFGFFSPPSWAEMANGCPDYKEPNIRITPLIVEPTLNTELSLPSLLAMARQDSAKYSSTHHEMPVGLTAASLSLDSQYKITTSARPLDTTVCAQISDFHLRFGFDDTIVYLARELPYDSCGYRTVLAHEMEHVSIDRHFVRSYMDPLQGLLREAIKQVGVVRASSANAAESKIRELMASYIRDLGANLSAVREKLQMRIDTKDEYSRLSKTCDGQLGKLVGQYVQH